MDLAEDFIQNVIKYTIDKCPEDLKFLENRLKIPYVFGFNIIG